MSEFENQHADAAMISAEIARMLVALGIDWTDETRMRVLAREALSFHGLDSFGHLDPEDVTGRSKQRLFGLIALMLRTMEEGAEVGELIHGSDIWKALAKALWTEKNAASSK